MNRLKDISFYIIIGFILIGGGEFLKSSFLPEYLEENLITLLIALLAINTATISVIMTKLKEIIDAYGGDFNATVNELRISVYKQIAYIIFAVIFLILLSSPSILALHEYSSFLLKTLLAAIFIASMHNLFDTAKSVFVILKHENSKK